MYCLPNYMYSSFIEKYKLTQSCTVKPVLKIHVHLTINLLSLRLGTSFVIKVDHELQISTVQPAHDKTNKMVCAPSEDSDQPGHPPSLIRVFAVRSMGSQGPKPSSCGQRRLWSNWVDAQTDLSLRWAHMPFCWFCHEAARFSITSLFHKICYDDLRPPHCTTPAVISMNSLWYALELSKCRA